MSRIVSQLAQEIPRAADVNEVQGGAAHRAQHVQVRGAGDAGVDRRRQSVARRPVHGGEVDAIGTGVPEPDLGRWEVTKRKVNRAAFKTPTLRDVARRGPYMHDGSLPTLKEVVAFYDRGGIANPSLSPEMKRLGLSAAEQADLVAFMESLTGEIAPEAAQLPQLPQ